MIALAVFLFLNAAFNIIVWPQFYKRVVRDPRARDENGKATAFLKVHVWLFTAALVLATASVIVAIAGLVGAL